METTLETPVKDEEAVTAQVEDQQPADEAIDEELADEVVVEISVDGMCGVY